MLAAIQRSELSQIVFDLIQFARQDTPLFVLILIFLALVVRPVVKHILAAKLRSLPPENPKSRKQGAGYRLQDMLKHPGEWGAILFVGICLIYLFFWR